MFTLVFIVLPTLVYCAGYGYAFYRIAGQFAWHMASKHNKFWHPYRDHMIKSPNGEMWFGAILTALIASIFWMISIPLAIGLSKAKKGKGMFYCPKDVKTRLYKERIAELERECGL